MRKVTVTTKTSQQIAADFEAVFKDMAPALVDRPPTAKDKLEPYRKEVMKQRRRGLTWEQIAAGMNDPRIGETVSERTLRRLFGTKPSVTKSANPATAPAPVMRMIVDRATGQRIIIPRPPS